MTVLLATDIILEHLNNGVLLNTPDDVEFVISVITEAELLRLAGTDSEKQRCIEDVLFLARTIEIDSTIARKVAFFENTSEIDLTDLLVAATALEYRIPLITKDPEKFKNIPEIEVRSKI
ncbi:MAG: PIN domain-containing protein [Candidatus Uhrbacteria bacterium]